MGFPPGFRRHAARGATRLAAALVLVLFLALPAPSLRAGPADRLDLKDGTHVDGLLLYAEEKPDAYVVNVSPTPGVVERREVPKASVASVSPGDGTADPAFLLVPPDDSQPEAWYDDKIRHAFDAWLAQFPKSPHLAEMQARRAAFDAERQRVAAGDIRRGSRWLGAAEAADWAPELDAQALVPVLQEAARTADAVKLQAALPRIDADAAAPSYPAVVRAALPALDACQGNLQPGAYADGLRKKLAFYQSEQDRCAAEIRSVINQKVQGYSLRPGISDRYVQVGDLWYEKGSYVAPYGDFAAYYDAAANPAGIAVPLSDDTLAAARGWLRQIEEAKAAAAQVEKDLADSDAGLKKLADAFRQTRAKLAALPLEKMESAAAAVRGAAGRIDAGDWAGAEPILVQAEKDWPGNLAARLAVTDRAAAVQARIDALLQAGKPAEAEALQDQAAKMVPYLLPDSARARAFRDALRDGPARVARALVDHLRDTLRHRPFAEFLAERAAVLRTAQSLRAARADAAAKAVEEGLAALEKEGGIADALQAQAALDSLDFAGCAELAGKLDADGVADGERAWARDLKARAQAKMDASDAQLARVNGLLLRAAFLPARAALVRAGEIWPANPAIGTKTQIFWSAVGLVGGVGGCVVLCLLLWIWSAASTVLEGMRYKVTRKKYAKDAEGQGHSRRRAKKTP